MTPRWRRPRRCGPRAALSGGLVAALVSLGAANAGAGTPVPLLGDQAKLSGIGDAIGDRDEQFGDAVAADGDTLVVGGPGHHGPGPLTGAAYVFVRVAGDWDLQALLVPSNGPTVVAFGSSVAVSGDTVVVGAPGSNRAYVFVRANGAWTEEAALSGSDTTAGDRFGESVSVSGDTIVVGAPRNNTGFGSLTGSAYVFVRSGSAWAEQQTILPADLAADDAFGQRVSVSGDSLVASSPGDDTGFGLDAGSAYVYARSGASWGLQAKLTGAGGDQTAFASAVSLDGDELAVGAPNETAPSGPGFGATYVFVRTGVSWSLQQRIEGSSSGSFPARFGTSVALDADTLIAGAPGELYQSEIGAVEIFARSGGAWVHVQTLVAGLPGFVAGYGRAVAVSGDAAFVGAPFQDESSGLLDIYRGAGSTWTREARLAPPGTTGLDRFGSAVAVEGDTLVIGAPNDDLFPEGRARGSVYVFVRAGGAWTLQQKIVADAAAPLQFGSAVALSGDTLAASAGDFFRRATYVFVRIGGVWQQQAELQSGVTFDQFGYSIALDGDTLVAGAHSSDEGEFDTGAAYVFARTGASWAPQQKLVPTPPVASAIAGYAVAIRGDTAFLGAPGDGVGKVTLFQRAAGFWAQQGTLSPSDEPGVASFGSALAVSGGTLLIGSPQNEVGGQTGAGAAYVFEESAGTWHEQQKLAGSSPQILRKLGSTMALSGNIALAGTGNNSLWPGLVYLFEREGATWIERQVIRGADTLPSDDFAAAIGVSGTTVVAGAPAANTPGGFESGAVYVFGPAVADLSVGLSGTPASVVQGDLVSYTIVVSNAGPTAAPGLHLGGTVDPGLVVYSASASQGICAIGASISCELSSIAAGGTATVGLVAVGASVGSQSVEATILWAGSDPVPGNESASVTTTVTPGGPADVSVTKTSFYTQATVDGGLTYGIDVTNLGPANAAGVFLEDPTPPGLSLYTVGGECSSLPCVLSRIEPGETKTIYASYVIPATYPGPDPVVNTATVSTATTDPEPSNDSSTAITPFFEPGPPMAFHTLTPCRLLDTRDPLHGGPNPLVAGSLFSTTPYFLGCGLPPTARALALNVTVTQPSEPGNLKLYARGLPVPGVSTINYGAGQTRANNAVVSLSSGGASFPALSLKVAQGSGTTHVIIDVFGYFE